MKTDKQNKSEQRSRWLRVGLLSFTLLGPVVTTIVERMRERSQSLQTTQVAARQRFDELTQTSRQLAAEQAQILQAQANQLQAQAQQLSKALRENTKQSRKAAEKIRKDLSQELLKRSEQWTEQGSKLVERGNQVTQGLAKRGKKAASDLAERSEGLLEPVRQRNGTFWAILGFSIGLTAALIATYVFVRRRFQSPETDQDEQIEIPQTQPVATESSSDL